AADSGIAYAVPSGTPEDRSTGTPLITRAVPWTALGSTKFLELPVLSFKTETLRKSVGCITYARRARPYIPAFDDASMKQSRSVPLHMAVARPVSEPRPAGAGAVLPVPNMAASTARA